jgi:pimeloyl-ACP methyl ester carboxylesterase
MGQGPDTLFAFHGFDNDAEDFNVLLPALESRYRLVCVNLFFHGKSRPDIAAEKAVFDRKELAALFGKLLAELGQERFSLLGFSLGGRICLDLVTDFGGRIDRIFLLAADGLRISPWYRFLTTHLIGRRWFRRATSDPSLFLKLAGIFRKAGMIGEKQYKFAWSYFNTPEKRRKVYDVWMIFRHILPDRRAVCRSILSNGLQLDLVFGRRDTVIPAAHAVRWQRMLESRCRIHLTDDGHNLLKKETGDLLAGL